MRSGNENVLYLFYPTVLYVLHFNSVFKLLNRLLSHRTCSFEAYNRQMWMLNDTMTATTEHNVYIYKWIWKWFLFIISDRIHWIHPWKQTKTIAATHYIVYLLNFHRISLTESAVDSCTFDWLERLNDWNSDEAIHRLNHSSTEFHLNCSFCMQIHSLACIVNYRHWFILISMASVINWGKKNFPRIFKMVVRMTARMLYADEMYAIREKKWSTTDENSNQ